MAEYTTLQQMSAANMETLNKNPFASALEGMKAGAEMGNGLLGRVIEVNRLKQEADFRQQELDQKKKEFLVNNFDGLVKEDDPILAKTRGDMIKQVFPQQEDMVDTLVKSKDARQQVLKGLSTLQVPNKKDPNVLEPINFGNPDHINFAYKYLTDQGNMGAAGALKVIDDISKVPAQQAQASLLAGSRQQIQTQKGMQGTVKSLMSFIPPEGQQAVINALNTNDFSQPLVQKYLADATNAKAQDDAKRRGAEVGKIQSETEKNKAEAAKAASEAGVSGGASTREDKILDRTQKQPAYVNFDKTISMLDRVKSSAVPGGNSLDLNMALKDVTLALTNSARSATTADKNNLSTLAKDAGRLTTYFTGSRDINPSDAEFQDLQKLIQRVETASQSAQENVAKNFLGGAIGGKQIRPEIANNWFKGRFGHDMQPPQGQPAVNQQGMYNVGGKQFSEDQLRQQAKSANDKAAAAIMFKNITGKDL